MQLARVVFLILIISYRLYLKINQLGSLLINVTNSQSITRNHSIFAVV
jgi:hypothetical protein